MKMTDRATRAMCEIQKAAQTQKPPSESDSEGLSGPAIALPLLGTRGAVMIPRAAVV